MRIAWLRRQSRRAASTRAAAALACLLAGAAGWAQDERRVTISPERPAVGSAFVIEVFLPGERAEALEAIEPDILGPARFSGADVRPAPTSGGGPAATISYRFVAEGAGRIDVLGLIAVSGTRTLSLGSWSIETERLDRGPVARFGTWSAPASVYEREVFVIEARGPDGSPAACPALAVEGLLLDPIPGRTGAYYAVAPAAGSARLPALRLDDGFGPFDLGERPVRIRPLPAEAEGVMAVGGPWRLELSFPGLAGPDSDPSFSSTSLGSGDTLPWELRAAGAGWPGLAGWPRLMIRAEGGERRVAEAARFSGRGAGRLDCVAGARGAFEATEPGVYVIEPEPYAWFDPASRAVRYASAPAVRVTVTERAAPPWIPPAAVAELAESAASALARRDDRWAAVAAAIRSSGGPDWDAALAEAERGADPAGGSLRERAATAALVLLSGSASERDRALAYAELKRSGRAAFTLKGLPEALDALDESYGNLGDGEDVLPPFGYPGAAGAALLTAAAVAAILRRRAYGRGARRGSALPVSLAVAGAALLAVAALAAAEDARPRFVCLGGVSRNVPSTEAEGSVLAAGRGGRVIEAAGGWLFVEPDGGSSGWLAADDAVVY
ncbi:MAG TPA: hypothetical protein PLH55_09785 [Spirochaetales bacterium]|nr:hypothetical protein [Spirochaetales bacterium]